MGEVAAHAAAALEDLDGRRGRACSRRRTRCSRGSSRRPPARAPHPARCRRTAPTPRSASSVGLAEPARKQPVEQLVGERPRSGAAPRPARAPAPARGRSSRSRRTRTSSARRQHEPPAAVAVEVEEARRLERRLARPALGDEPAVRVRGAARRGRPPASERDASCSKRQPSRSLIGAASPRCCCCCGCWLGGPSSGRSCARGGGSSSSDERLRRSRPSPASALRRAGTGASRRGSGSRRAARPARRRRRERPSPSPSSPSDSHVTSTVELGVTAAVVGASEHGDVGVVAPDAHLDVLPRAESAERRVDAEPAVGRDVRLDPGVRRRSHRRRCRGSRSRSGRGGPRGGRARSARARSPGRRRSRRRAPRRRSSRRSSSRPGTRAGRGRASAARLKKASALVVGLLGEERRGEPAVSSASGT